MATTTIEVESAAGKPRHAGLERWVNEVAELANPTGCIGAMARRRIYQAMLRLLVLTGTAIPLDAGKRPNSFLVRSDPADVARVEDRTYICARTKEEAGPTNNWEDPAKMKEKLAGLFAGAMAGRTMYVVPYSMARLARRLRRLEWRLPTRLTLWSA